MKKITKRVFGMITVILLGLLSTQMVSAGVLDDGLTAYQAGNYVKAEQIFRKEAEKGNVKAQFSLAAMYYDGVGVTQSDKEAFHWFEKAANKGQMSAATFLGDMYNSGRGVTQSFNQAYVWYRRAAERGDAYAIFNLGIFHMLGKAVEKDENKGIALIRMAADQGDLNAKSVLKKLGK